MKTPLLLSRSSSLNKCRLAVHCAAGFILLSNFRHVLFPALSENVRQNQTDRKNYQMVCRITDNSGSKSWRNRIPSTKTNVLLLLLSLVTPARKRLGLSFSVNSLRFLLLYLNHQQHQYHRPHNNLYCFSYKNLNIHTLSSKRHIF